MPNLVIKNLTLTVDKLNPNRTPEEEASELIEAINEAIEGSFHGSPFINPLNLNLHKITVEPTEEERIKIEEIKDKVEQLRKINCATSEGVEQHRLLCEELKDKGWKLRVSAYRDKTIKKWRVLAHWVKPDFGDVQIFYYNEVASSKVYALDMQSKSEVPPLKI